LLGRPEACPIILNVGRLVPQKGQRYAIAAMPRVVAAHPHARLVIVGEGWLRGELQAQIRALGMESHVALLGERHDVSVLIQAADLFAFPSLSEGFGVALLEALGAGRPCVVSRIPALTEVTDDGRVALLVDARSSDALAAGIIRLAGDRGLAERLGDDAATFVRERYNVVTSMRSLERLYGTLVDRPVHTGRVSVGFR
jgi:glycosyltransferase involved in cell wall biosynthesis